MKRQYFFIIFVLISVLCFIDCKRTEPEDKIKGDDKIMAEQKNTVVLETTLGKIKIELYPAVAPKTVKNFLGLVNKGYYDNVIFHRVIPDFMIQGGDPTGTGSGGESIYGTKFEDEINPVALQLDANTVRQLQSAGYKFTHNLESMRCVYGTICMANAGPDTNGSQFFIVTREDCRWLDGRHTVFGKIIEGMDVAVAISNVERDSKDRPLENVVINKAYEVEN